MLGVVSTQLGRHRAAVECIGRALALRPDWPDAHNNLGNVQRERGSLDQAIACYRRALELKPDHPEFLANLANVLGDRGELDEAVASYRRARWRSSRISPGPTATSCSRSSIAPA